MFDKILTFTLGWEGGYSFDKDDPGGETKYGISKRSYPNENIKGLTLDRAKEIYKHDYWNPFLAISDDKLLMAAFDTAVNIGVPRTKNMLNKVKTWEELVHDREEYYRNLAVVKPLMQKYLKGWLNRTTALRKLLEGEG